MENSASRLIVGLTGGIGSGKTAVSDTLAALGADVVDTDVIAHQLTAAGGAAMPAILSSFGQEALLPDGSMNRAYIRGRVFKDPQALQTLETILHPLIRQACLQQLQQSSGPYAVLVVPLLLEKQGWQDMLDAILVVDCPEPLQIERVQRRSGLEPNDIQRIMQRQVNRDQRLKAATHVILNDGDLQQLQDKTRALHTEFVAAAREKFACKP
jgi:dephospho-CoA kinase